MDYGDAYLANPASSPALSLDGLSFTYFAPNVRALAKGYHQYTESYTEYLRQQEDILEKVSNSATELNRPKLAKSTVEAIQLFDTLYTAYLLDGGKAD